jgi:glycerate 2-kinase
VGRQIIDIPATSGDPGAPGEKAEKCANLIHSRQRCQWLAQRGAGRQDAASMRVLIAFDKFKGALAAPEACAIVARVLRRERPSWELDLAPLADGGDGFARILTEAAGGASSAELASGPLFPCEGPHERWSVEIGWVELAQLPPRARARLALEDPAARRLAVLEMAAVNGLARVPSEQRDVWRSSSRGTGELIRSAAAGGADAVLLGVGGSASSDLGLGALSALGLRFETAGGRVLDPPLPAAWSEVVRVAGAPLPGLPPVRIACDVKNPLLGPQGAAAVYGLQKGLAAELLPRFEAEAARLARLLCEYSQQDPAAIHRPGAGAAGGIAFGLSVALGARLISGFELVAEWLDLAARLERAELVITGEGRFDRTSLEGKGPGALLQSAAGSGRRCAIFAGAIELSPDALPGAVERIAISDPGQPLELALPATSENLARALLAWLERSAPE